MLREYGNHNSCIEMLFCHLTICTCKKVGHIKMTVIPDLKAATEEDRIKRAVDAKAEATTDAAGSYSTLVRNGVVADMKLMS